MLRTPSTTKTLGLHSPTDATSNKPLSFDSPVSPAKESVILNRMTRSVPSRNPLTRIQNMNGRGSPLRRSPRILKRQCGISPGKSNSSTQKVSKKRQRSPENKGGVETVTIENGSTKKRRRLKKVPDAAAKNTTQLFGSPTVNTPQEKKGSDYSPSKEQLLAQKDLQRLQQSYNYGYEGCESADWAKFRSSDERLEVETEKSWQSFRSTNGDYRHMNDELTSLLCKHGISREMRPELWMLYSGGSRRKSAHPDGYYFSLTSQSERGESSTLPAAMKSEIRQVDLDVPRSCPHHPWFLPNDGENSDGEKGHRRGRSALRRVLLAHLRHNGKIGYVQGMNYLAAFLMLALGSEESAFWVLSSLCEDILPGYFAKGLPGYRADLIILKNELQKRMPILSSALTQSGVSQIDCIAPRWLLCLYYSTFRPPQLALLWDRFFFAAFQKRGPAFLIQTALALIEAKRDKLTAAMEVKEDAFVEITKIVQNTLDAKNPQGCAAIFRVAKSKLLSNVAMLDMALIRKQIDIKGRDEEMERRRVEKLVSLRRCNSDINNKSVKNTILRKTQSEKLTEKSSALGFLKKVFTPRKALQQMQEGIKKNTPISLQLRKRFREPIEKVYGPEDDPIFERGLSRPKGSPAISKLSKSGNFRGGGGEWIELAVTPRKVKRKK
eukprot:g2000.t1